MKTYTEAELRGMDDDQLLEIAVDQLGLGALAEPEEPITDEAERESIIRTILDQQADTLERGA